MYFSKAQLRPGVSIQELKLSTNSIYQQHKAVWQFFHSEKKEPGDRSFIYRHEQTQKGLPEFFILSKFPPLDREGIWNIQVKPYNPIISNGELLEFQLRANPVVCNSHNSQRKRHDIVMYRKHQLNWNHLDDLEKPVLQDLIYEVGLEWLSKRSEYHGFEVVPDYLRVDRYENHSFFKRQHHPIQISTLDFSGQIRVSDEEKFANLLHTGLGPAKGFGCGLFMVKRI